MKRNIVLIVLIVFLQSQAFCQLGFVSFPVLNSVRGTATNTEKFIETLAHEYAHNYTSNERIANSAGSFAKFMWDVGNVLNFTRINTSGNATSTSWYNANYGSNLLQSNTQMAKSISYDDREHSTLAYRGTKTILNAAGIETSSKGNIEDNIAGKVLGLTIGTTDKAEERQDNLLYGLQKAGEEYEKIPEDIAEIGKKAAETAAEVYENKGKAWEAGTDKAIATHIGEGLVKASLNPEIWKTATDTGMGSHLGGMLVYTSVNPGEAADKIGGSVDGLLFETIRKGFNNDNLVYAIGQVWSGTISDIGLLYGGASLFGSSNKIVSSTGKLDIYYHSTNRQYVDNIINYGFRTDLPNRKTVFLRNRFGDGVYLADSPATALAERPGGIILKVAADKGKSLDITNRGIIGGDGDYSITHSISRGARKHGYNSIIYKSSKNPSGINTVIFAPDNIKVLEIQK